MVRRELLILAGLTVLIACGEQESPTTPKVTPALEPKVIEHAVDKAQELDNLDPEPSDQVPEMDISPNEEDLVLDSVEAAALEYPEETSEADVDAAEEFPPMEQHPTSSRNVDHVDHAGTQYTVKAGDTLSRIALSKGVTVSSIVQANKLSDKNTIRVGQQLIIE